MSTFEPKVITAILRNSSIVQARERETFKANWKHSVNSRVERWEDLPTTKAIERPTFQLKWEAEVVEYVNLLWNSTRKRPGSKSMTIKTLGYDIPILGPRFVPPTYLHMRFRPDPVDVKPETQYLKPLNIIHPLYYPELAQCPQCKSHDIIWEGWTTTGAREVHGITTDETALGLQLRCDNCKRKRTNGSNPSQQSESPSQGFQNAGATASPTKSSQEGGTTSGGPEPEGSRSGESGYCFALTSQAFWRSWNHWEIPNAIPIFYKRCALTRQLFDLVIEIRPSTTSGGLAERVKQLHLLEYNRRRWEYLQALEVERNKARGPGLAKFGTANTLKSFSLPNDPQAYADRSISHEIITEVFLDFSGRTRKLESDSYLRSLPTCCGSIDSTFKSASKATITDHHWHRSKELRGGLLSMLNEKGEIVAWRFCQTKANAEVVELLHGIRRRHELLGLPMPEMMVTDNCCQVRNAVQTALPETHCVLDVWHFVARYVAVILNSGKNIYRTAVAADITNAILKSHSVNGTGARYWSKSEQEEKLEAAFLKWVEKGTVWSAAATQVHQEQLKHVRKGCLERCRQDILSDGSRIEGSHKGWNSLQRAQPSGVTVLVALGHDFVLRRNIRVAYANAMDNSVSDLPFLISTHGSHHVSLISAVAALHNQLLKRGGASGGVPSLPELCITESDESFGLTTSSHASTFGGMMEIKEELTETDDTSATSSLVFEHNSAVDLALQASRPLLEELHIDLALLDQPCKPSFPSSSFQLPAKRKADSEPAGILTNATLTQNELAQAAVVDASAPVARATTSTATHPRPLGPDSVAHIPPTSKRMRTGLLGPGDTMTDTAPSPAGQLNYYFKVMHDHGSTASTSIIDTRATNLKPTSWQTTSTSEPSAPVAKATAQILNPHTSAVSPASSASLTQALPRTCVNGLTRSQRLFSLATNIDPRSLLIQEHDEFYLFMDMRAEFKWISHEMTPRHWVQATMEYNRRLLSQAEPPGPTRSQPLEGSPQTIVLKNPLALSRKLGEIEQMVMTRIVKGEFKSKRGPEDFWRKHCFAVVLVKPEGDTSKKSRKAQTCSRCQTIMYPGPEGSSLNHKKGYCSDGVKQVSKDDTVPPWPQPKGIFTAGKTFHPQAFCVTIRDIYERYCATAEPPPITSMEVVAFISLLAARIHTFGDGSLGFRLPTDYEIDSRTPNGDIIHPDDGSGDCLRLAYLQPASEPEGGPGSGANH